MKNILIVDDEFLIRYSLSHMLQKSAVEVTAVSTATEALRQLTNLNFDLCCLDIHLPDMNGIHLMKKIHERQPDTKIIMMTGAEVTDAMLGDISRHSELLLSKPFDLFKVKTFVDRLLTSDPSQAPLSREFVRATGAESGIGIDQRRHFRYRVNRDAATVFDEGPEGRTAEIIDKSDHGMCLITSYLLQRGALLTICNDKTGQCSGTVRWSMRTAGSDLFRTGVELRDA